MLGGKVGRSVAPITLPPSCPGCLEILGALRACRNLYRDCFISGKQVSTLLHSLPYVLLYFFGPLTLGSRDLYVVRLWDYSLYVFSAAQVNVWSCTSTSSYVPVPLLLLLLLLFHLVSLRTLSRHIWRCVHTFLTVSL